MAENKTKQTEVSVTEFINSYIEKEQKRKDSFRLVELMQQWSGCEPKMWGPTIIGFGSYHYKYASGHEGDAPMIGFSPRKAEFSLYVLGPESEHKKLLSELGTFRMAKYCIYFKKLDDLNLETLEKLSKAAINHLGKTHECACHTR